MSKILHDFCNLLAIFVEINANLILKCYISCGDDMKQKKKNSDVFNDMIDNIKYAKRLMYINYYSTFDKKK